MGIKLTFREGGAFDFSTTFERMKETLNQAADVARDSGRTVQPGEVDLEQLPAYEETVGGGPPPSRPAAGPATASGIQRPTPMNPNGTAHTTTAQGYRDEKSASGPSQPQPRPAPPSAPAPAPAPNEPPPGYEEAQQNSVVDNLERRVSGPE